jgi:hypothetical protein
MDEASEQTQDGFVRCFLFSYELSDGKKKYKILLLFKQSFLIV